MLSGIAWLLFLAAFSFLPTCKGHAAAPPPKVVVLVVDALDVETFTSPLWVRLRQAASTGVVGLMNVRPASTPAATAAAAGHVTLGAGTRAPAVAAAGLNFGVNETVSGRTAGELYEAATGRTPPEEGIVVLAFESLEAAADLQPEGARPGLLGARLAATGRRIAIVGNADAPRPLHDGGTALGGGSGREMDETLEAMLPRRHGALLAMDDAGRIPWGVVDGRTLARDAAWPLGLRTDYDAMWVFMLDALETADVVVVELGDFSRLDAMADWIRADVREDLERETIRRVDDWIGRLAAAPEVAGGRVLLVVPSPSAAAARENLWLTPFASFALPDTGPSLRGMPPAEGDDGAAEIPPSPPGLATSRTTRRAGIVAGTDAFAAVLAAAGVDGRPDALPIRSAAEGALLRDLPPTRARSADPWRQIASIYDDAVKTYKLRPSVVRTFVISAIGLFVGAALGMAWDKGTRTNAFRRRLPLWQFPLLLLCCAPLAMLLLPLLPAGAVSAPVLSLLTGLLAATFFVLGRMSEPISSNGADPARLPDGGIAPYILASGVTAAAIMLDAWLGSPLMKSSVLGFDPIVGARYYGIGNEYMGVLIATAPVASGGWLDRRPRVAEGRAGRLFVTGLYALVCVTLASPAVGANVGGTVAAAVGAAAAGILLWGGALSWRSGLIAAGTAGALLVFAGALDLLRGEANASHLGQTLQLFRTEGLQPLLAIAYRKVAMNLKLLRWTIWAQVFLVSFVLLALFFLRFPAAAPLQRRHPRLFDGIRSATLAACVALVVNDSGIVAAATAMIPVTATLMHAALAQPLPMGPDDPAGNRAGG